MTPPLCPLTIPHFFLTDILFSRTQTVAEWRGVHQSPGGRMLLEPWGFAGRSEAEEVEEALQRLAAAYTNEDE